MRYTVVMPLKDVTGAAARMLTISVDGYAPGRNHPGRCTRWVYFSLGATPERSPLPDAVTAWNNIPANRRLAAGANLVKDMPYFLGATRGPRWKGDLNWMYGDVVLATGRGREVACTDKPGTSGIIGLTTLDARAVQTGRPILGGGSSYGGWDLTSDGLAPIAPEPTPNFATLEDDEMRVFANAQTDAWAAGTPGRFKIIPQGQGDLYLKMAGQTRPIVLTNDEMAVARDFFLQDQDTGLYAVTDGPNKDQWFVVGPGVFYRVKPGENGAMQNSYGPVRRVNDAAFQTIRNINKIGA